MLVVLLYNCEPFVDTAAHGGKVTMVRGWTLMALVAAAGMFVQLPAWAQPATANSVQLGLGFR
jgi:hypothetical protein